MAGPLMGDTRSSSTWRGRREICVPSPCKLQHPASRFQQKWRPTTSDLTEGQGEEAICITKLTFDCN